MLKRLLLSHSAAYFFVLPIIGVLFVYILSGVFKIENVSNYEGIISLVKLNDWLKSENLNFILWSIPVVLTIIFIPLLTSRFVLFEKGMFLNSLVWLGIFPAFLVFSGNYQAMVSSLFILPVYYFVFGMYKSEFSVHLLFNASLSGAFASLFYLPAITIVIVIWIGWIINNAFSFRHFLLSITAILIPFIFAFTVYFLNDNTDVFINKLQLTFFESDFLNERWLVFSGLVCLYVILGSLRLAAHGFVKKIGTRRNLGFSLLSFFIFAIVSVILHDKAMLMFAIFPASVMVNLLFVNIKNGWIFTVLLVLFFGGIIACL